MGLGDTTICVYQFIFDKEDINDTHILHNFFMNGLGLCIILNSYVAHIFYTWPFNHNTLVPIYIKQKKNVIVL